MRLAPEVRAEAARLAHDAYMNHPDHGGAMEAALDAALPAIIGAVLEKAAQVADKRARMANTVSNEAARALLIALPDAIRALAEEARNGG